MACCFNIHKLAKISCSAFLCFLIGCAIFGIRYWSIRLHDGCVRRDCIYIDKHNGCTISIPAMHCDYSIKNHKCPIKGQHICYSFRDECYPYYNLSECYNSAAIKTIVICSLFVCYGITHMIYIYFCCKFNGVRENGLSAQPDV
jgi:hypothetical protein